MNTVTKGIDDIITNEKVVKRWSNAVEYLPVNLFGSVMGIAGLSLAWKLASKVFGTPAIIGEIIGIISAIIFITLSILYIIKLYRFTDKVSEEFNHPITGNFFGTITIAFLLLSIVLEPISKFLSYTLWIGGSLSTITMAYIIVQRLMIRKQDQMHATPSWLIPGVGTLDVAIAGGSMPFTWGREINLFTFAIGSVLALFFLTIIFSRLIHFDPMSERLTPTKMILVAPFAVGFLSYTEIIGHIDFVASILFYFGLFIFIILAGQIFRKRLPFSVAWWAVSFPMAALSNAALKYADYYGGWPLKTIAALILVF